MSDDDLPDVHLSPVKKKMDGSRSKSRYNLPDASVVAEKRRQMRELDDKIRRVLEEDRLQQERDAEKQTKVASNDNEPPPNDVKKSIQVLDPDVELSELDVDGLLGELSMAAVDFLKEVFQKLIETEDEHLGVAVDIVWNEVEPKIYDKDVPLDFDELLCITMLTCSLLLNGRCRKFANADRRGERMLSEIFLLCPAKYQTPELLMKFTNIMLKTFPNPFNRLYLSDILHMAKWDPCEIDSSPLFFANRLAKYILFFTLFDLVGYEKQSPEELNSYKALVKVVQGGEKFKDFSLYQYYILMNLIMNLMQLIPPSNGVSDKKAKKWFLQCFRSIKVQPNERVYTNVDFYKVKDFVSRIEFQWIEVRDIETNGDVNM